MPQTASMTRVTEGEDIMGWNDFYRRRDIIDAVLREARRDPHGPLPFAEIDGAKEAFGSEEQLLLALQYKWTQALSGQLRAKAAGPEDSYDVPGGDDDAHVDAVSNAWLATVRANPALRAVLDGNVDRYARLREAYEGELCMLAITTGLADPTEPREEIVQVGSTYLTLLRSRDRKIPAGRRANPFAGLLRKLAPAS